MIGTDPAGQGGIAAVVSVLVNEGFFRERQITYISSHVDGRATDKFLSALRSLYTVFRLCVLYKPGIVHAHSASRASFFRKSLCLAVARAFGCKTVFHLHGGGFRHFVTKESGALTRWWIRRTLEKSSRVIALSDGWAGFIGQIAPRAVVEVIQNSVRLGHAPDRDMVQPGRILFLGRVQREKGVFELLSAVSALKERFPELTLAIGGDGDLDAVRTRAQELGITDNLEILGWIGKEQKESELAKAAIFALPSYNEGLPMAMLEAMASGKAIVVTAVGGIPEAVVDGVNGKLIPPRNTEALTSILKELLVSRELRERLGDNARKTIETRFSTEVVLTRLGALYDELEEGGKAQGT